MLRPCRGVVELLAQRPLYVVGRGVPQRNGGFAEAQAFLALVALNSAGFVPGAWQPAISGTSRACLVMAIAALGLKTSVTALREAGWRPLALMIAEAAWIAALALALVVAAR